MILALDTATDRPTLALGTAADPGEEIALAHRHDLSREIDPVVTSLFERRGLQPMALSAVLVADGPGSFTGLRIGVAFAKGLARALAIPLLTAPSMLGAARASRDDGTVVASYDALRGEVYRAIYRFGADGVTVLEPPSVVRADDVLVLSGHYRRVSADQASAAALLSLVDVAGGAMVVEGPAAWEPVYGRPAEAEARLLAKHGQR